MATAYASSSPPKFAVIVPVPLKVGSSAPPSASTRWDTPAHTINAATTPAIAYRVQTGKSFGGAPRPAPLGTLVRPDLTLLCVLLMARPSSLPPAVTTACTFITSPYSFRQCRAYLPLTFCGLAAAVPVSASTLTRKRKLPPCCTPSTNCTFTLAPLASAPPGSCTTSAEFKPPPKGCTGLSSTVPFTTTSPPSVVTATSPA